MPDNMSNNVSSDSLFNSAFNYLSYNINSSHLGLPILSQCQYLKRFCLKYMILLLLATLLSVNLAYGVISVTSLNTIQGRKPYLLLSDGKTILTDLNELLGFSMPKQDGTAGTEQIKASMANNIIKAPNGMKYADVITFVKADGILHNLKNLIVADADGDAIIANNTKVTGQIRATWYKAGMVVPASDLDKPLEACEGPYTLKIEIPTPISANTAYGNPRTNVYGTHPGIIYTFMSENEEACYLPLIDNVISNYTPLFNDNSKPIESI